MSSRQGREIVYCFKCARQLTGRDFETGTAFRTADVISCAACTPRPAAPAPPVPATTRRVRADRPQAPSPAPRSGSGWLYGGLAAGGAGLLLVMVFLLSGEKPVRREEPAAPPPVAPKAPEPKRADRSESEAKAAEALEWARSFAKAHPRDFEGQLNAFALAVKTAEKTSLGAEARREQARVMEARAARAKMSEALDHASGGLVGWWRLDEGQGGETKDASGNGRTGRLQGPQWSAGRTGGGLGFADGSAHVNLGLPDAPPPWTAALWIRRVESPEVAATLLDSKAFSLRLEQFDRVRKVGITKYGAFDRAFEYTAPIGEWVHLAFVGTADGTSLHVNGAPAGRIESGIDLPLAYLGSFESKVKHAFHGTIDEVRAYRRALSAEEIRFLAEN